MVTFSKNETRFLLSRIVASIFMCFFFKLFNVTIRNKYHDSRTWHVSLPRIAHDVFFCSLGTTLTSALLPLPSSNQARNPEGVLIDYLQDAPDRSTIEAYVEDSVLIRAHVCRGTTMATFFSTQAAAVPSSFVYVQLPRKGSWMNAAKSQLGLHSDRRVMARRLTRPSSVEDEPPSRIPEDLRHGDTLFFFVLEEDIAVGLDTRGSGDGVADAASPTRNRKAKKGMIGLLAAAATTVTPEITSVARPVLGDTVEEALKGPVVPVPPGVATTSRVEPALGRGCGPSVGTATRAFGTGGGGGGDGGGGGGGGGAAAAAAAAAAQRLTRDQLRFVEQTEEQSKDAGMRSVAADGSNPPIPVQPPTSVHDSYGIAYPESASASPALKMIDLPSGAATAAAFPSPGARYRQPELTMAPGQFSMSQFGTSPPVCPQDDGKPASGKKLSPCVGSMISKVSPCVGSTASEDDEALAELVGMGFDREHVLRALRKCGRRSSWKETAISLLLEPQLFRSEDPETDLEAGLNRCTPRESER